MAFALATVEIALLLEIYLYAGIVDYLILQISQRFIGNDFETSAIPTAPFAIEGEHTLLDVSIDIWMHIHYKLLHLEIIYEIIKFLVEFVGEKKRGLNLTLSETARTGLGRCDIESGTHTLASDLHKSELT